MVSLRSHLCNIAVVFFIIASRCQSLLVSNIKYNGRQLPISLRRKTCLKMDLSGSLMSMLQFDNNDVNMAFNVATFLPQPFWFLMILAPNWSVTQQILRPWWSVVAFSLVHLFIVVVSASQTDGTAPMAEFGGVFDPSGNPQQAMMGMMNYPNFVTEEWSHVLTWDFFVGRFIWLDGLNRGIFTPHSVLLSNLIGPPGLLLHYLTCFVTGKSAPDIGSLSLPVTSINSSSVRSGPELLVSALFGERKPQQSKDQQLVDSSDSLRADTMVRTLFASLYDRNSGVVNMVSSLAESIVWEDTSKKDPIVGRVAVERLLASRVAAASPTAFLAIEKVAEGKASTGFTWHLEERGRDAKGLQGTTFVSLDASGKIDYVREVAEPLFKPGPATAGLLKAVAESGLKKEREERLKKGLQEPPARSPFQRRDLINAADTVSYLWLEVQGSDKEEALRLFSEDIIYEDLNFASPFMGKAQVSNFLDEFDIPGIRFVPERISEGTGRGCCFTWHVEIAGTDGQVKGISFYQLNEQGEVSYIRDIPEPSIKPPPLQTLAALVEPGLRCLPRVLP